MRRSIWTRYLSSYNIGREDKLTSNGWVSLQPVDNAVGPEISFARKVSLEIKAPVAIIKCAAGGTTLGGDCTPEGKSATDRNVYSKFIASIQESIRDLEAKGHPVELAGIVFHVGENDMAFGPYRKNASKWLQSTIAKSRQDLALPGLKWYVSQQLPPDEDGLDKIDVTADLEALAAIDPGFIRISAFSPDLPSNLHRLLSQEEGDAFVPRERQVVFDLPIHHADLGILLTASLDVELTHLILTIG